ncbi:helix-turn-helix transcriptional regulator [Haliea sp. E1-2-M8]|uniref:helix-turn-helix transcriptional regulator n=1 Tax=Haliea sp. E1-2-M8 TaxID=3064706 RepID=UPI00271CD894|nr:helix-turn-helix transcriptional regulator [Haliea sp. E1-2-M8]MDO8862288.1 helix-turn-helix transcriptional regulator [Haliea sp. E1-2-M8]
MGNLTSSVRFRQIVDQLYEGIEHDDAMSRALDLIGRQAGMLISSCERFDLATGQFSTLVHSGNEPGHPGFRLLEDRARELNPYYKPEVVTGLVGEARFASDVLPQSVVRHTAYYSEYLGPLGVGDIAGYFFETDPGVLYCLSFPRDGSGVFPDRDRTLFRELAPHIFRAFSLRHQLLAAREEKSMLESVLEQNRHGLLLLDDRGQAFWRNSAADSLLARKDGLDLSMGSLTLCHTGENRQFQRLLRQQLAACSLESRLHRASAYHISQTSGLTPYTISLHPLNRGQVGAASGRGRLCAVVVDPLRQHEVTVGQLMRQYDLTLAEANVAVGVGSGLDLEVIADQQRRKVSTTRNLLKRAMRKTDTHRQAELGARIWALSLPVNLP